MTMTMIMFVVAARKSDIKATLVLWIAGCAAMVIVVQVELAVLVKAVGVVIWTVTHAVIALRLDARALMSQRGSSFQG